MLWFESGKRWRAPAGSLALGTLLILNVLRAELGGQEGPGFNRWIAFTIMPAGVAAVAGGVVGLVPMVSFRSSWGR